MKINKLNGSDKEENIWSQAVDSSTFQLLIVIESNRKNGTFFHVHETNNILRQKLAVIFKSKHFFHSNMTDFLIIADPITILVEISIDLD